MFPIRLGRFLTGIFILTLTGSLLPKTSFAGEIYGRVAKDGKVYSNVNISISCGNFEKSTTTDKNGVYRSPGPQGEKKCNITVQNSNPVSFFSSSGRTRVNLEITGNNIRRR